MEQKNKDIIQGLTIQKEFKPIIEKHFNIKLIEDTYEYAIFDYYNNDVLIEIKSRNNNHNTYKTTMIGYNKIEKAKTSKKDVYFIFKFLDGLFYYKYNKNDIFQNKIGGRDDRDKIEYKLYTFIPYNFLTKINY